jgi:heat shock transcription factor
MARTSRFVNDSKTDDLIRWSASGNSFMVLDEEEFSKKLIPDLFKHNNYASFVRQLNMYGFHKVVGLADGSLKTSEQRSKPPSEYENPYFKRGHPDLMWLIQKPKSKNARAKGKKGVKQEEQDTDKEDNMSDAGGGDDGIGGAYIEGPKDANDGHGGSRNRGFDFNALSAQIEAVRSHQLMISQAINRLRKDHQQLYEQSLAFQNLHDRHENSINAILTFLATVYDKSLGGHINGAVNNLFSHQVDQGLHRGTPGAPVGPTPAGAIIPTAPAATRPGVMRTPQLNRRKPLLLEGGPGFSGSVREAPSPTGPASSRHPGSPNAKVAESPTQHFSQYQQHPNITELFTPPGVDRVTSPADSPQQHHAENPLGAHQASSGGLFSPPHMNMNAPTSGPAPQNGGLQYTAAPNIPISSASLNASVPTPRSIAKALGAPFATTAQALHDHNASLAQKSQEIEDLEALQTKQNENIDQLMGMMRDYVDPEMSPVPNGDITHGDVDQFFDFGSLPGDGFVNGEGYSGNDGHGHDDIDELLRSVEADEIQNGNVQGQVFTNPNSVAGSPVASSIGSRAREELEEEIEEVQPKRRRMN